MRGFIADEPLPTCEYCGNHLNINVHRAMTAYPFDGEKNSIDDPNKDLTLCDSCWEDYKEYWADMWREYYANIL